MFGRGKKVPVDAATGLLTIPLLLLSSFSIMPALAQVASYYQNTPDGYRVLLPDGWIVEDKNNDESASVTAQQVNIYGSDILADFCPEGETLLPAIGGGFQCGAESVLSETLELVKFPDLHSRPEFAALLSQNKTITSRDIIPFFVEMQQLHSEQNDVQIQDFRLQNMNDTTVDVIDSQTNQTKAVLPAKFAELIFQAEQNLPPSSPSSPLPPYFSYPSAPSQQPSSSAVPIKMFGLFVVANNTTTGYSLYNIEPDPGVVAPPAPIHLIMDSFELLE